MALNNFHPKTGHVLICDFTRGFIPPEMIKRRPVVVISRTATHSSRLCTIVPLSTTAPQPIETWHVPLLINPLKSTHTEPKVWAKCDMLYTVSFDRLDLPAPLNQPHSHRGLTPRLSSRDLDAIFHGVKNYLPNMSLSVEGATRKDLNRP